MITEPRQKQSVPESLRGTIEAGSSAQSYIPGSHSARARDAGIGRSIAGVSGRYGNVRCFCSKNVRMANVGIDAPTNDSGDVTGRHMAMSKIGASFLRGTLLFVISVYLQNSPPAEPAYSSWTGNAPKANRTAFT